MKAEHRKELQTNLLADRVGRALQGARGVPGRRMVLFVLLGIVVFGGGILIWVIWTNSLRAQQDRWVQFDEATDMTTLMDLGKEYAQTPQGKSARAQIAWIHLWEYG